MGVTGLEPGAPPGCRLAPARGVGDGVIRFCLFTAWLCSASFSKAQGEAPPPPAATPIIPTSTRLQVNPEARQPVEKMGFEIPLPAHAQAARPTPSSGFHVSSARNPSPAPHEEKAPPADYLLPDRDEKPPITPENSNLNLPAELEITARDTGEKILLPAGTYRQILQIPIDSPFMKTAKQVRRDQSLVVERPRPASRYAEPEKKPVWVRYESLEKIKVGEAERRGGIDLPSHGPAGLGPRVWYAKSETADTASSLFYFVFGGLGYATANVAGWSAGNTREIAGDFEYRLIRR